MSISSFINMIRDASSAYEMRSEIVGAFLELNNTYLNCYGYTSDNGICHKFGSNSYWGKIQNGNAMAFPNAQYLVGQKLINQQGTFYAVADGLDAYSTIIVQYSRRIESISEAGIYNFGTEQPVTEVIISSITIKPVRIKQIIERTINDLWDTDAPKPIQDYLYAGCHQLSRVYFSESVSVAPYAFYKCENLSEVSFYACDAIGSNAFKDCTRLVSLYLTGSAITSLFNSEVFSNTPIAGNTTDSGKMGSIYVPASLYNSYKTAQYWSLFSNRLVSMV